MPQCTSSCITGAEGSQTVTRIIPDLAFTCTGTVTKWKAAGMIDTSGSINAMLGIWRNGSVTLTKINSIELGSCNGMNLPATGNSIYECILPENETVSVQLGDIVGIEIATNQNYRFRLYFDNTNGGPTNYVFSGQVSTVALDQASSTEQHQPQITLIVEPIMSTTVLPTTEPLTVTTQTTTTESVELPTTQLLLTTTNTISDALSEAMTTIATAVVTLRQVPSSNIDVGLIIGSVVGGVVGIILLSALIVVTLALVYLAGKYKGVTRNRNSRISMEQYSDTLNMETKANQSYVPVFREILTKNNTAYSERVNKDSNDGYLTIIASTEDKSKSGHLGEDNSQAYEIIEIQNEEDHYYY